MYLSLHRDFVAKLGEDRTRCVINIRGMGSGLCKSKGSAVRPQQQDELVEDQLNDLSMDDNDHTSDHPAVLGLLTQAVTSHEIDLSQPEMNTSEIPQLAIVPQLRHFPRCVLRLHDLRVLHMRKNKIGFLPDEFGKKLPALEILDASDNHLKVIPSSIGFCVNLKKLILFKNQLTELPEEIVGCRALLEVNCFDNQLTQLPNGLTQLELLEDVSIFMPSMHRAQSTAIGLLVSPIDIKNFVDLFHTTAAKRRLQ